MKYKLEWKYKMKGKDSVTFYSDWLDSDIALNTGEDLEKSGKATELYFEDEIGTSWTLKEVKKLNSEIEEEPHDLVVYFDGGFQASTNEAGLGVVVFFKQGKKKYRLRANDLFHEMDTNNEAEYAAFYFALNVLEELNVHHLPCEFRGDSQVVLKQLDGEWPCYEDALNSWLDRIEGKLKKMSIEPRYKPIPRKENQEADKLATQALQGKRIFSKSQIL